MLPVAGFNFQSRACLRTISSNSRFPDERTRRTLLTLPRSSVSTATYTLP